METKMQIGYILRIFDFPHKQCTPHHVTLYCACLNLIPSHFWWSIWDD